MIETRTIEHGKRTWLILPDAAAPLLADGWPPDSAARLQPVKRGKGRTVSRFECGGKGYYVKAYAPGSLFDRLRSALGLGPGRREWDVLLAARAAGLDVPEPVALARGGAEALVTAEIAGARRLDEYLFERYFEPRADDPPYPGARPPELVSIFRRRRAALAEDTIDPSALAALLADLLARLDEADMALNDLHPGNLLLAGGPGTWRLYLVDLAEAVRSASDEALVRHLVELEHFFEPIASPAERLRCLRRIREVLGRDLDPRMIVRATTAYRRAFYRRRDHRTRRESKYFARISVGGWHGWAAADWGAALESLLAAAAGNGFSFRDVPGAVALKEGATSSVWRVSVGGRTVIVKQHNKAAGPRGLGRLGRATRSVTAFRKGHALLVRGIATARPVGAANLREGGHVGRTLLFTEPVDGERLSDWLRHDPPARERRRVTWLLARMLRRMHDAGFAHRDLKAPNVLVAPARGGRPVLVDLDGVRTGWHVSDNRRARDLMRLSVSLEEWGVARKTDRLRFLRAYLGVRGGPSPITIASRRSKSPPKAARHALGPKMLRRWWRRIAELSRRKLNRLGRKNR
jgi:tRNA A-37 threonylcarbamoyl transferase component Bud32